MDYKKWKTKKMDNIIKNGKNKKLKNINTRNVVIIYQDPKNVDNISNRQC